MTLWRLLGGGRRVQGAGGQGKSALRRAVELDAPATTIRPTSRDRPEGEHAMGMLDGKVAIIINVKRLLHLVFAGSMGIAAGA
jgi:hypothetical protein